MSSLWKKVNQVMLQIQAKNPSPMLRKKSNCLARGSKNNLFIKRIPLWHLNGSMTVEAAVVIPLILFFFVNLLSSVEMLRLHGNLQLALWDKGRILAVGGYVYDSVRPGQTTGEEEGNAVWEEILTQLGETLLTDYLMQSAVINDLGNEYLNESPLTYGENGLVFLESSYMENDCIDVKVTYQVSPVFKIPGFSSFRMANRYFARAWTGYQVAGESEEQGNAGAVYITEYGEVYHVTRSCSYLVRNVMSMDVSEVEKIRNQSGARYRLCSVCGNEEQRLAFVTQDGNRYHSRRNCPGLVRNIITMDCATAKEKYRPCSKCAA